MVDNYSNHHKMKALGIDTITSNIHPVYINGAVYLLKVLWKYMARPIGLVNLLVGWNEAGLHPTGGYTKIENLRLLYFEFGNGKLLDGIHPSIKPKPLKITKLDKIVKALDINDPVPKTINLIRNIPKRDKPEFVEAE